MRGILSEEERKGLAQYTQHAGYNMETKKPYVEIKKKKNSTLKKK